MLLSVNYYDEEGRLAKVYKQHYQSGGINSGNYDEISNSYNFEGALTASNRIHHNASTGGSATIVNRYDYDHVGRKLRSYEQIDGGTEVLLAEQRYNEIGQLKEKGLGGGLQNTAYAYNERGWLKSSNSNEFSLQLKYQDGDLPQFNGNISGQLWGNSANTDKSFSYSYDKINRLLNGSGTGMSEAISYDVMGNITSLNRDGQTRDYVYNGNQLLRTTGLATLADYQYDPNGNATVDGRTGKAFTYNTLNLPETATGGLSYVYDASGRKIKKKSSGSTTDYIDGIQYTNGAIELIQTEVGIARRNGASYSYEYNLSDHLGNNRVTFYKNPNGGLEVLQRDDYYAFGLRKSVTGSSTENKYLYNGKELQDELGQYDYGARFYDPVIGRFSTIDPLSEISRKNSPYGYALNNPIRFIDVDGMFADEPTPEEAALIAAHAYGCAEDNIKLKGGWAVSNRDVGLKASDYTNSNTGIKSALYERTVDGKTEYVYATAGTEVPDIKSTQDIVANGAQVFGTSAQYDKSVDNAKAIKASLGSSELTYVGHSLGGGEASVNAIVTGDKAITFNASGISIPTKMKYGGFMAGFTSFSDKVTAYQLKSDPLTILQDATVLPGALGTVKMISPQGSAAMKNGHSILSVIKSMR